MKPFRFNMARKFQMLRFGKINEVPVVQFLKRSKSKGTAKNTANEQKELTEATWRSSNTKVSVDCVILCTIPNEKKELKEIKGIIKAVGRHGWLQVALEQIIHSPELNIR